MKFVWHQYLLWLHCFTVTAANYWIAF